MKLNYSIRRIALQGILLLCFCFYSQAQSGSDTVRPILFSSEEMPSYKTFINAGEKLKFGLDDRGDRIPDFSYCGYQASEKPIPDIPVKVLIPEISGDASGVIQSAINYVSSLPLDSNGFRGTILLEKGSFELWESLIIRSSGVVLRGSGSGRNGTILKGMGVDRKTLIQISGNGYREMGEPIQLAEDYFPVNSTKLVFKETHSFLPGDQVLVMRPSTSAWLALIGADQIGGDDFRTKWTPGDFDINWDRTIVSVTPNSITIDAPITNALDPNFGGGSVASFTWEGRIRNVGVENLHCMSSHDASNPKDENHRWMAITLNKVCDAWVRRVEAEHFVSSAVAVWKGARRITIEDCKSLAPVGEAGNFRRYSFHTLGQQVLFQRCYAEHAYHAFSVGFTAPGPNAFVQCYSHMPGNFSGTIGGWATGVLFDRVTEDGGNISLSYRDMNGQGGGWSAANSLCWQCRASKLILSSPPGAQNWAFGNWAQRQGKGHHEWPHTFLNPESFFYAQLKARTEERDIEFEKILSYTSDETTAPTPQMALRYSERSGRPDLLMDAWIDSMIFLYPIESELLGAIGPTSLPALPAPELPNETIPFHLTGGRIIQSGKVVTGTRMGTSLWRGTTRPSELADPRPNLVRFVPGRTGRGLTDDLDTLTEDMLRDHVFAVQHFPSLWYERRRDDHSRTRRDNADVWTPFYEQPFSRSGIGEAYDRLSKYDLSKWNPWYWARLKKFADLADQKGLLLIQEHYLQHNILEEGAHWVDYPWRSANNINELGFAEPPHYAGDKRVYMAHEFYDTTHLIRNHFHREYIRKNLDNFKHNSNVIHHLGKEYTGPLHFVQFWLDVIREWELENNKEVFVMLPGTKEVQDAILADPLRSDVVDLLDIIQWQYRKDGSLYAPVGGVSLTQRQYARIYEVGETSFAQIYRAVLSYREAFPDKGVVYSRQAGKHSAWAVFMAGGSFAAIPDIQDADFLERAAGKRSYSVKDRDKTCYVLGGEGTDYILFSESSEVYVGFCKDLSNYRLKWIHPLTGACLNPSPSELADGTRYIHAPFEGPAVACLYK